MKKYLIVLGILVLLSISMFSGCQVNKSGGAYATPKPSPSKINVITNPIFNFFMILFSDSITYHSYFIHYS